MNEPVTAQIAIEAAPSLIYPDGQGGIRYYVIEDAAISEAATQVADFNGWSDDERDGLYAAVVELLAIIGGEVAE